MLERPSYVYLGGFRPHPQILFVKVGKADNPVSRAKAYATHLPGGLSFLYAAEVASSDAAYIKESHLMVEIAEIEGCRAVGGEWFRVEVGVLPVLVEALRRLDADAFQVKVEQPRAFSSSPKASRVRGVRAMKAQRAEWRRIAEALPEGVAGAHSGRTHG